MSLFQMIPVFDSKGDVPGLFRPMTTNTIVLLILLKH
jgi:hypothetical protein